MYFQKQIKAFGLSKTVYMPFRLVNLTKEKGAPTAPTAGPVQHTAHVISALRLHIGGKYKSLILLCKGIFSCFPFSPSIGSQAVVLVLGIGSRCDSALGGIEKNDEEEAFS